LLLQIWHKISKKIPEWQLSIYGEGIKNQFLARLIIDLNLTKSVNL